MLWQVPRAISIVAGASEGLTEVTAFDRALIRAGIASLNFLRVTSILPPDSPVVPLRPFPAGMLMPAVYARITSHTPGEQIAAAIGVGRSRDSYGVIMEYSHRGTAASAEEIVRRMMDEAFAARDLVLHEVVLRSAEHAVARLGCAVAAVLFWPDAEP